MQVEYARRSFEIFGAMQVLGVQQAQEFRVIEEILPGKLDQSFDRLLRWQVSELQPRLGGTDADVTAFQHREIKRLLITEVVIDHPLVGAGARGDGIDAGAA